MIARYLAVSAAVIVEIASLAQVLSVAPAAVVLPRAIAFHAAAALLVGWAAGAQRSDASKAIRRLFAAGTAFLGLPVFGIVAVMSCWAASTFVARRPRDTSMRGNAEAETDVDDRLTGASLDLYAPLDVQPLVDLLQADDPDRKRGAIEALVGMHGSRAAGMLQALLHDSDPEIRLYASIRVSGLEDEMGRAIHAARAATETSASEVDAWRRLVLACSDYISSGLLDEATATQYLVQAEEAYHVASQLQPGQGDLAMMLGRACQAIRHFDPAREYFAHAAHGRDAALAIDARIGLMEVAFAQRSLADVKAYAALAAPEMAPDDPRRPVVEWWAQAA